MDEIVARCPDCGMEQATEFANCFVCMKPSRWWCSVCREWRPTRACASCSGGLAVPSELFLGSWPIGTVIPFTVLVRNAAKKLMGCTVACADPGVLLSAPRLLLAPSGTAEVRGRITLPPGPLGRRAFLLRFESAVPCETVLAVEAAEPFPQLEFNPSLVVLRTPNPGSTIRTSVALKNTGNIPLEPALASAESWLVPEPKKLTLSPGESAEVELRVKSKKTDSGPREAKLTATATGGTWEAMVRYTLPDPELTAAPVAFGELKPGKPAFVEVVVRNTGRVRVDCTAVVVDSWLRVLPERINLPPGREKKIRVRAVLTTEQDGSQTSELLFSSSAGVVLRVPVTATGKVPRPLLRPIRKQRVRDAASSPIERKFQIANDGAGRLNCEATADQAWVKIITPSIYVAPGKKRKLRYVLDLPTLPRGEHTATITLTTNAGTVLVPVTVTILDPNPVLDVLPAPNLGLIAPEMPITAFVQVRNAGIGLLFVKAESESPRVIVTPAEADVPTGPPVRFGLVIPVEGLPGGEHEAAVQFTSNGGSGRAAIRFRLPVELLDVPSLIHLGERPAGRLTGGVIHIKNIGPYPVKLCVRGEHQWLQPTVDRVSVPAGETVPVPFRMDLQPDVLGPAFSAIILEGRAIRHTIPVRAIACRVALEVSPGVVSLGDMEPGTQQTFTVEVTNTGEMVAHIRDSHTPGTLEVWVRRATVKPGETVTVTGRVRVNTRQINRQLRASATLTDELTVQLTACVVSPLIPRALAVTAATGGLIAGSVLSVAVAWWLGVPVTLLGFAIGALIFWRTQR